MAKFNNQYRIPSARAPFWDYGRNALYFVTICTKQRICWFGGIERDTNNRQVVSLSPIGEIAQAEWLKTFEIRPDMNLWMGAYVIMPNHFHAIIGIGKNDYNSEHNGIRRDAMPCVSIDQDQSDSRKNRFGPQSKNLASIIRGFKIGVSRRVRKIDADFAWQARYHDRIIRDNASLKHFTNYILLNPMNWNEYPLSHKAQ